MTLNDIIFIVVALVFGFVFFGPHNKPKKPKGDAGKGDKGGEGKGGGR